VLVFLFGSYDSRGGTTAIAAPDRDSAMAGYARACWLDDLGLDPDQQRQVVEADYLGPANLEGELPVGVEAVDLEWDLGGAVFCKVTSGPAGRDDEDRARWSDPEQPIELLYIGAPLRRPDEIPVAPAHYWCPRWDDDAYGFVLVVADV